MVLVKRRGRDEDLLRYHLILRDTDSYLTHLKCYSIHPLEYYTSSYLSDPQISVSLYFLSVQVSFLPPGAPLLAHTQAPLQTAIILPSPKRKTLICTYRTHARHSIHPSIHDIISSSPSFIGCGLCVDALSKGYVPAPLPIGYGTASYWILYDQRVLTGATVANEWIRWMAG